MSRLLCKSSSRIKLGWGVHFTSVPFRSELQAAFFNLIAKSNQHTCSLAFRVFLRKRKKSRQVKAIEFSTMSAFLDEGAASV